MKRSTTFFLLRVFVAATAALMVSIGADAQYLKRDWSNEVSFGGSWTPGDHFGIEFSYFWFPLHYVGIGAYAQMGATSKSSNVPTGVIPASSEYYGTYNVWILMEEHQKVTNLSLVPSVLLATPDLNIGAVALSLRLIPGIGLTVPRERVEVEYRMANPKVDVEYSNFKYQKYWLKGPQWWYWSGRAAINVNIDELGFGIGYRMSNQDIWATRRTGKIEGTSFDTFYPSGKKLYHSFYLYVAWKF
ncbi:MAG: hypothetical protein IJ795_08195 [Bacteroidales bacterium]|nr:hypothetical protein [Bacteroidales bacterium]